MQFDSAYGHNFLAKVIIVKNKLPLDFYKKNIFIKFSIATFSYLVGIFYNRGITLELHSEGIIYNNQAQELFISGLINPYPQRILTPFLANLLNITTQQLNLTFIFIFLLLINFYFNQISILTRLILSIAFVTTMPVIFSMNFGGYPDIVSYTIFILILFFIDKEYLPFILFLLLLLTREAFLIYLPFFIIYKSYKSKQNYIFNAFGFVIPTIIYFLYYLLAFKVASTTPGDVWDYSFYIQPLSSNIFYWIESYKLNYFVGIFSTSKFLIILILIVFIKLSAKQKAIYLIFIFLTLSTSLVCGDLSRCFSPLIFSLLLFPKQLKFKNFNTIVFILFCFNLVSPKYYVWHGGKLNYLNDSRLHFLDIFKLF